MKKKAAKELLAEIQRIFPEVNAQKFEEADFEGKRVYFLDNHIEFIRDENGLYPFIGGVYINELPSVIVDMGAIPHICNGADIMAPGIVKIKEPFNQGEMVVIRDISYDKALAIGRSMKSSREIEDSKKGKVVQNLNWVGDKLWNAA